MPLYRLLDRLIAQMEGETEVGRSSRIKFLRYMSQFSVIYCLIRPLRDSCNYRCNRDYSSAGSWLFFAHYNEIFLIKPGSQVVMVKRFVKN